MENATLVTVNGGTATAATERGYRRRSFSNMEKLALVRNVKRRVSANQSIRSACEELKIIPKQYREWLKKVPDLARANSQARSLSRGPPSILTPFDDELLRFVFELREQGMAVSILTIVIKAAQLSREFREKNRETRMKIVGRWKARHSLVYRMGTHESQRAPNEVMAEATDFMEVARGWCAAPNRMQEYIINMDQTPVFFSMTRKKTLALLGTATINIRKSTNDTKRATLAVTVTASGQFLTPYLVFKGTETGRIAQREFKDYPNDQFYACQTAAWMDERVMLSWVKNVLKPYVDQAPDGVVPLLFLDSYRCHMMASVMHSIQELGVEVQHIPGGCTSLCQPVDVGINKPLKTRIRDRWEEWMIADGLSTGTTGPPTRKEVAQWCSESYKDVTAQIVRNSWRHNPYSYFPPTVLTQQQAQTYAGRVEQV
jgi:transposase-like protein